MSLENEGLFAKSQEILAEKQDKVNQAKRAF